MALVLADRVKETAAAPGTGTVTLLGAEDGYQSFSAVGNTNTTYYTIADQSGGNWEVGIGTYTASGSTLTRDTVLSSSNAGALVNFSSGVQDVFVTYPSEFSQTAQVGDVKLASEVPIGPGTWLETGKYYSKAAYPLLASKLGDMPDVGAPARVAQAQIPRGYATGTTATATYLSATNGSVIVAVGASAIRTSTDGINWTNTPSRFAQTFNEIRYVNGNFVSVGGTGSIVYSTDGYAFDAVQSSSNNLLSVAYGASRYVVVGAAGYIASSADLVTWTASTGTGSNQFNRVVFGAGVFVAMGVNGACYSSTDGIAWTVRSAGSVTFNDVIFANSQFTAVCASQAYTSPDGLAWTPNVPPGFGTQAVTSANYLTATDGTGTVVVGSAGQIRQSTDGSTWSFVTSPTASNLNEVRYLNSALFVAVGASGTIVTSSNRTTWTAQTSGTAQALNSAAFGAGRYVAVGAAGAITHSTDGITWAALTAGANAFNRVAFGAGVFVAVGAAGACYSSPDGITWTSRPAGSVAFNDVIFDGTQFVAICASQSYTSTDGITWAPFVQSFSSALPIIGSSYVTATDGTSTVAVGNSGQIRRSTNGTTWSYIGTPTTATLYEVRYLNSALFIAVGASGAIVTSPDGIVWTSRTSGTAQALSSVAYGAGRYVAVGGAGAITYSSDGVTWTAITAGASVFNRVIYNNSLFVAVGASGVCYTSPDGVTWTSRSLGGSITAIYDITYGAGLFVAVGTLNPNASVIRTSSDGITWNTIAGTAAGRLQRILYANSLFVTNGSSGLLITSPDGVTWTSQGAGTGSGLYGSTWTGSKYVIVTLDGGYTTSPDGITWTAAASAVASNLFGVATQSGITVGFGVNASAIVDGATSVQVLSSTAPAANFGSATPYQVLFANSLYVVPCSGGAIYTAASPTGAWTLRTSGTAQNLPDVIWTGSKFIAAGLAGAYTTSSDGVTWSATVDASGSAFYSLGVQSGITTAFGTTSSVIIDGATRAVVLSSTATQPFGSNTPNQVQYLNGLYVVPTNNGALYTSSNGTTWAAMTTGLTTAITLFAVEWSGSNYFAVGTNGVYLTSADGVTWTPSRDASFATFYSCITTLGKTIAYGTPASAVLEGATQQTTLHTTGIWSYTVAAQSATNPRVIAYNGSNLYVAAGSTGVIMTSPDGLTWTGRYTTLITNFDKVAYVNGNWIAMGGTGSATNLLTSPDAITWTALTAGTGIYNYAAYGAGVYVVVGASGAVFSSPDLATWTTRSAGAQTFNDVIFANSIFVAVGAAGSVYSSPDGITWTSRSAGANAFQRVIYANSLFVAVGASGGIYTSADGATWTLRTSNVAGQLNDIVWNGSLFVAVGASGVITSSADGVTWTDRTPGDTTVTLNNVSWSGTQFLATNTTNFGFWISPNGITWSRIGTVAPTAPLFSGYLGGKFLSASTSCIQSSTDGLSWTNALRVQYVAGSVNRMIKLGGMYYALTNKGLLQSSNGIQFAPVYSTPNNGTITYMAYSGTKWLAISYAALGSSQSYYQSTDGTTWTKASDVGTLTNTSTIAGTPFGLEYAAGNFVTMQPTTAAQGLLPIATSPDGVTWTQRSSAPIAPSAASSTASDGQTVAYLASGVIISSADGGVTWAENYGNINNSATVVMYDGGAWVYLGGTVQFGVGESLKTMRAMFTGGIAVGSAGFAVANRNVIGFSSTGKFIINLDNGFAGFYPLRTNSVNVASFSATAVNRPLVTRGNFILAIGNASTAFNPLNIYEIELYSYNTTTTFFVPAVSNGLAQKAYIYAGA
jgi:hypothetical protein